MKDPHPSEPEKLDLRSHDIADDKRQQLLSLFPEVRTEGGKIDFDRLKAVLGEMVDAGRERYGMNWPGKAECMRTIQAPSMGTLLPMREESVDWDTTENVIIEGDNLEVLKLLQKSYLGKVKMIYIDPPYNTGNDFIYPDNYSESLQTYLDYTGQVDNAGRRYGPNTETDGRFHSKWLNMMYPRLYLARQLLRDDGVIFISIDESEVENLRRVCSEVFGEENFYGCFIWEKKKKPSFLSASMGTVTDYILCYAKNKTEAPPLVAGQVEDGKKYPFNNAGNGVQILTFPKGSVSFRCPDQTFQPQDMSEGNIVTELLDPVVVAGGKNVSQFRLRGEWRYSQEKLNSFAEESAEIVISKVPFRPNYINRSGDDKKTSNLLSYRVNGVPTNEDATEELRQLFGMDVMSYPKPSGLIKYLVRAATDSGDIVMDFFAGSGTTGHACWNQEVEDGKHRKFVLVQLPEFIEESDEVSRSALKLCSSLGVSPRISEVMKERLRRVASRFVSTQSGQLLQEAQPIDLGFRVFKLSASNFIPWDGTAANDADQLAKQLQLGIEHTREDRTPEDLLYEILLKSWGEPALSLKIDEETIEGVRVFSIADGAFLICLEETVNLDFIRAVADRKPDRVVMRESAFAGNDQLKANAVQTFKSKGVTSFKVV
jgi:adenine-specific DNA-methyltransferase